MKKIEDIRRSITKRFRSDIWKRFVRSVSEFDMISSGDKIAVCISGGKDSFLLALLMQELQKHWTVNFELEFLVMNPGYREKNLDLIRQNAAALELPIKIFDAPIFEYVTKQDNSPCYLCARMRRGYLYRFAGELGCNKIALGHHFDDVIETALLSLFYASDFKTMMPKLKSTSHPGMELIRPMYFVKEENIVRFREYNELEFLNCACRFTEEVSSKKQSSKRQEIKELINDLKKHNKNIDINIYRSLCKVNLNTILGYVDESGLHSFLETY